MKRKVSSVSDNTRSKKQRINITPNPTSYIAASDLYNYMLKDPITDWLKSQRNKSTKKVITSDSRNFLLEKGKEFEKDIINYIRNNISEVITISEFINDATCTETIRHINLGTPIIHSAPVRNIRNNTHGVIDLLVRSDFINLLIEDSPLSEDEKKHSAKKLNSPYHYIVIDIKFSTLPLRSDKTHLLNCESYPYYKAQCLIYTEAIGLIQGFTCPYAFILGRRWKSTSCGIITSNSSPFNKLGRIDFSNIDSEYKRFVKKGLKWLRDVKTFGRKWTTNPPSRNELYPNMRIDSGVYNEKKQSIADNLGEITRIWYCGIKNRENALEKGVSSWKDKRCTAKILGINGTRAPIVDKILNINRQNKDVIRPKRIRNNLFSWKNKNNNEIFVDFETISDVFSTSSSHDIIFMIGVYHNSRYRNFVCKELTLNEEFRIMSEFIQFLNDIDCNSCYFWYAESRIWRSAECRQYDKACEDEDEERKNEILNWNFIQELWKDLFQVFIQEPIVIKGCFKFGLKEISNTLRSHGLISCENGSECKSGMEAMIMAGEYYKKKNNKILLTISKYNQFDCKVLYEILEYLRGNHI